FPRFPLEHEVSRVLKRGDSLSDLLCAAPRTAETDTHRTSVTAQGSDKTGTRIEGGTANDSASRARAALRRFVCLSYLSRISLARLVFLWRSETPVRSRPHLAVIAAGGRRTAMKVRLRFPVLSIV